MAELGRIAIVGLGLIGGSLAQALRRARPELHILGVDADAATRELARASGAVNDAVAVADAPWDGCDVVVLAVPAQALVEMLPTVAGRMRAGAVLTDVCGAKERVCAVGGAQSRVRFVGAHPMAGTEFRGFAAAQPGLFDGCTVAIAVPAESSAWQTVRSMWQLAGAARFVEVAPAVHDRAVAFASHLPYLAAAAVVESMLDHASDAAQLARDLAAGGFRDTTRLAGDGTVGGAAALNRFVTEEARGLAERLRGLADELDRDPGTALARLGRLADERRRMKLPPPTLVPSPARKL
jgi:prephenate dehydrogenase